MLKTIQLYLLLLIPFLGVRANGFFVENRGQFPSKVLFQAKLSYGSFFIEKDRFTGVVFSPEQVDQIMGHPTHDDHDHEKRSFQLPASTISGHSFQMIFKNALPYSAHGNVELPQKENYFIGNDASKWASNLNCYQEVFLTNVYPNVDVRVYFEENSIKYDYILQPTANSKDIQVEYVGFEKILHKNNQLTLKTSVGDLFDTAPFSYYENHPNRHLNTSFQKISENTFGLSIPIQKIESTLIIDPQVSFVTFTGATVDNWGYTATFDDNGYGYAGGITFGTGYPTVTGSFQTSFGGGMIDISISKFSPDGKNLIYSTYIGGIGQEAPHSMIVNSKNELVIYGVSSSVNYPTNGYDNNFNGGVSVLASNVLNYTGGTDIVVTILNSTGSNIVGSTYFGGNGNDGLNDSRELSGLFHNYGDIYRGEVIVDANDNVIIASTTESKNLPITGGFQPIFGGGNQDGCVAKFSSNLGSLMWSSYFGGSGDDACYAAKNNSLNETYITGGTTSSNLPSTNGSFNSAYSGSIDGYLARISSSGNSLMNCTYVGTNNYDQSYFVEVDIDDDVYCFGQSLGTMPISSNTYNVAGSKQFLQKYNNDLSLMLAATTIGSGRNSNDIVPGAFMVSNCKEVYISGWGGVVNAQAGGSASSLKTTSDAFQKSTDGSDFYLALLGPDFASLKYGTYIGGNGLAEHVDGGTSRFDRNGTVYQAVCAGCGGSSAFPVTAGAYSTKNKSENCNLALIKMDISKLTANIKFEKDSTHCLNKAVNFKNQSTGGTTYKWIYPDGTVEQSLDGKYFFTDTGVFNIKLIAIDSVQCPYADTADLNVKIIDIPKIEFSIDTFVCLGTPIQIKAEGGPSDTNYVWWNTEGPIIGKENEISINPNKTTEYAVQHTNKCGSDIETVTIPVYIPPIGSTFQDSICGNDDAVFYFIESPDYIYKNINHSNYNIDEDSIFISVESSKVVYLETRGNCGTAIDTFDIYKTIINTLAGPDTLICPGERVSLYAYGGDKYNWLTNYYLSDSTIQFPYAHPQVTKNYIVRIDKNNCSQLDTARVKVHPKPFQSIDPIYYIDYSEQVELNLNSAYSYTWTPADYLSCKTCANTISSPEEDIKYYITYKNDESCSITDSVEIKVRFPLYIANTFTPNNDNNNDVFYAFSHLIKDFEMDIYNRWGNHIFHSSDINSGWDGTFNGQPQQEDVYVWKIKYTKIHSNKKIEQVGHVNLIR